MRIVDPKHFDRKVKKPKRSIRIYTMLSLLIAIISLGGYFLFENRESSESLVGLQQNEITPVEEDSSIEEPENLEKQEDAPKELREFTDNEFKVFYDNLLQPNLERVSNPPEISGNVLADARIRDIAEERGYKLRNSPSVDLVSVDGYLLQQAVAQPWSELKKEAASEGLSISIVSGYRSVERQRQLYLSRLAATGATISQVSAGKADEQVNKVLVTSSIPGYSKHHTGYTIDILCAGFAFENFKNSSCNDWITADNYKVAKQHGFIPSYPPLADSQGPDPEAWEYVWVGTELLYE